MNIEKIKLFQWFIKVEKRKQNKGRGDVVYEIAGKPKMTLKAVWEGDE